MPFWGPICLSGLIYDMRVTGWPEAEKRGVDPWTMGVLIFLFNSTQQREGTVSMSQACRAGWFWSEGNYCLSDPMCGDS